MPNVDPKFAKYLAGMGRGEDTEIAHVAPGEIIVPNTVQRANPSVRPMLEELFRRARVPMDRYVVEHTAGPRNPKTGKEEFFSEGDGPNGTGQDGGESTGGGTNDYGGGDRGGGSSAPGGGDVTDAEGEVAAAGGHAATAASQADAQAAENAAQGFGGPGGGGQPNMIEKMLEALAIGLTRGIAQGLPAAQKAGLAIEEAAEKAGFNYDRADEPGFQGGATRSGTGDPAGLGQGEKGGGNLWEEGVFDVPEPADAEPEDPTADQPKDFSLSSVQSVVDAPNVVDAYRRPGVSLDDVMARLRRPTGPQINPQTGLQMFDGGGGNLWEEGAFDVPKTPEVVDAPDPYAKYRDDSGNIRAELVGGKWTDPNSIPLDTLQRRQERIDAGFDSRGGAAWGGGNSDRYMAAYSDHDNNPETPRTAPNESNINRSGEDVSATRDAIRSAGGTDVRWGSGDAMRWLDDAFSQRGWDRSGNVIADAYRLRYTPPPAPEQPMQPVERPNMNDRMPTRFNPLDYLPPWLRSSVQAQQAAASQPFTAASYLTPPPRISRFASMRNRLSPSFMG